MQITPASAPFLMIPASECLRLARAWIMRPITKPIPAISKKSWHANLAALANFASIWRKCGLEKAPICGGECANRPPALSESAKWEALWPGSANLPLGHHASRGSIINGPSARSQGSAPEPLFTLRALIVAITLCINSVCTRKKPVGHRHQKKSAAAIVLFSCHSQTLRWMGETREWQLFCHSLEEARWD